MAAGELRVQKKKPGHFARPYGAGGLTRMRFVVDEEGQSPENALVAYRRELYAIYMDKAGGDGYFRRTLFESGAG